MLSTRRDQLTERGGGRGGGGVRSPVAFEEMTAWVQDIHTSSIMYGWRRIALCGLPLSYRSSSEDSEARVGGPLQTQVANEKKH
jgi:hypothetical protein